MTFDFRLSRQTWPDITTLCAAATAAGFRTAGAALTPKAVSLHDLDVSKPLVLVFGSELEGLSPAVGV